MASRRTTLLGVLALTVAACGSGDAAESTTTVLPPVSSSQATTTTTAATTTTTSTTLDAGSQEAGVSPQLSTVRAALAQSSEVESGRIEGSITVTGALTEGGEVVEFSMPYTASFDAASGNSAFSMDLSGIAAFGGEEVPAEFGDLFGEMEVREIDGTTYIRFPFFGMLFGAETPWISAPSDEGDDLTQGFTFTQPSNPSDVFESFTDADGEVTEIGRETVNGVETTHYVVAFDTEKLIEEASDEELARLRESGPLPATVLPMDIWISDAGQVIRYVMDIDGTQLIQEDGEEFDRMVMQFDLFDLGQPVEILPPDPSLVTDIESLGGAGLFGGLSEN